MSLNHHRFKSKFLPTPRQFSAHVQSVSLNFSFGSPGHDRFAPYHGGPQRGGPPGPGGPGNGPG